VGSADVPKWIDLYWTNWRPQKPNHSFGELFALGIYEMDGDQLKLCLAGRGSRKPGPRPKTFSADPHSGNVLLTLQRHRPSADEEGIQGNWTAVTQQMEDGDTIGETAERAITQLQFSESDVFFDMGLQRDKRLVYTQWGYVLDPGKQPKTIDMHGSRTLADGTRKTQVLLGIYKLENDRLTLAYRQDGPRPEKFESTRGSRVTLLVLERPKSAASPKPDSPSRPAAAVKVEVTTFPSSPTTERKHSGRFLGGA